MAKTIAEQLLAMLPENERAAFRAKLDMNPKLIAQDVKSTEIYSIYQGDDTDPEPVVVAAPVTATAATVATAAPVIAPVVPTVPNSSASGNESILAELRNLSASINGRFETLRQEFIPMSKLDEYRTDWTNTAMKGSDDLAQVRENHRAEFGKPLDRDAFETYVINQKAAGVRFKDLKQAHDMFVQTERTESTIAKRVEEQVKQKRSADTAPGQTQSIGLSPSQAVLKKAREGVKGGDGKSNAMAAAQRLSQLERARDESQVVQ